MTFQKNTIRNYKEFETPEPVALGDGRTVDALGTGTIKVTSQLPRGKKTVVWLTSGYG